MQSLKKEKLHLCSNTEVLHLYECKKLQELDVNGINSLRCIEVHRGEELGERIKGVEKLSNIVCLHWYNNYYCLPSLPKFIHDLSMLTVLEVVVFKELNWLEVESFPPNLNGCSLKGVHSLWHTGSSDWTRSSLPNFSNLPKSLMKIDFKLSSYWRS